MCATQKCRMWPSEQNSSIIGENLTHLAEDWCVDYSNINILSGPCCGFYVTSMYTAQFQYQSCQHTMHLLPLKQKRQHLSIVLHSGIQQRSLPCTFKIGYTSIRSGSTCQIINFFCNILSDVSSSNTSFCFHPVGC